MIAPVNAAPAYLLDNRLSRFTVRAFASGMLSSMGHNPTLAIRDFSGTAVFDPEAPERSTLQIRIRADSLEVTDDIKARDRMEIESTMNRDVLRSEQFPEISFVSTGVSADKPGARRYRVTLDGELTLRGISRNICITPQVTLSGDMLRASGDFSIRQSDFGIPPVSVAGGALRLKDELKVSFDIVSQRQV